MDEQPNEKWNIVIIMVFYTIIVTIILLACCQQSERVYSSKSGVAETEAKNL